MRYRKIHPPSSITDEVRRHYGTKRMGKSTVFYEKFLDLMFHIIVNYYICILLFQIIAKSSSIVANSLAFGHSIFSNPREILSKYWQHCFKIVTKSSYWRGYFMDVTLPWIALSTLMYATALCVKIFAYS